MRLSNFELLNFLILPNSFKIASYTLILKHCYFVVPSISRKKIIFNVLQKKTVSTYVHNLKSYNFINNVTFKNSFARKISYCFCTLTYFNCF